MASPAIIEPSMQRAGMDCGIASLSMLICKPYVEVSEAAIKLIKDPHESGMTLGRS